MITFVSHINFNFSKWYCIVDSIDCQSVITKYFTYLKLLIRDQ